MPTAGEIMNRSAVLLNDKAKTIYTYVDQLPHLNTAIDDLSEELELNNVAITNVSSAIIPITTLQTDIGGTTGPVLPADLIEIQRLWERQTGTTNSFLPMDKYEFLPNIGTKTSSLVFWSWQKQIINFVGANLPRDVKIDYIAAVLPLAVDENSIITKFNSRGYLSYRTAALCARFIGENPTRADELDREAQRSLDRVLGIDTKGRQSFSARRRPFRAGAKVRGLIR